jgi:muramoyltetrapeptide carboxypeptidase LdcA involved in peptidoglycan recycling
VFPTQMLNTSTGTMLSAAQRIFLQSRYKQLTLNIVCVRSNAFGHVSSISAIFIGGQYKISTSSAGVVKVHRLCMTPS